jgi:hypothetical protein
MKYRRQEYYLSAPLSNPSEIAKPVKIAKLQNQNPPFIRCNRPDTAEPEISLTLLFRGFAEFVDDCEAIEPDYVAQQIASELSHKMCDFYPGSKGEAERMEAFRKTFNKHGYQMASATVGPSRSATDFDIRHLSFVVAAGEGKVEIGQGGGEPLIQASVYYSALIKEAAQLYPQSSLPCILLYVYGRFSDIPRIGCSSPAQVHM